MAVRTVPRTTKEARAVRASHTAATSRAAYNDYEATVLDETARGRVWERFDRDRRARLMAYGDHYRLFFADDWCELREPVS